MSTNGHTNAHLFGIGVQDDDDDLQELINVGHPKHPKDPSEKMERILSYLEQTHVTTRDNNSILFQMLNSMEERINKRIDRVREEMIELINKSTSQQQPQQQQLVSTPSPMLNSAPTRRASALELKTRGDRYSHNHISPPIPPTIPENFYDMVDITPQPGFAIKTRKLIGEKNKVFINVFHHELIALTPPGLKSEQAKDKPYMMMEVPTCTTDHAGVDCLTFNVGISSEYFTQPNPKVDIIITAPVTIYKIIHKINLKFNEFLDENAYSIPRLANGYKGDQVPVFRVPQLRSEASTAARRHSSTSLASTGSPNSFVTDTKMTTSTTGKGTAGIASTAPPPATGLNSNSSSTYSLAETMDASPIAAKSSTSIAAIWAATHDFDDAESDGIAASTPTPHNGNSSGAAGRASPSPSPPPLHPATSSAAAAVAGPGVAAVEQHQPSDALARRPSDHLDNDSVMSDITTTTNTVNPHSAHLAKTGRRGSLLAGLGLSMGTRRPSNGSADGGNNTTTTDSQHHHPIHRKISRKSVLITPGAAGYNGGAIQGRNLLSGDMLEYKPDENVDNTVAEQIKEAAITDPAVLLGWQIWVSEHGENTMYVVTDVRKNFMSKVEYRISMYKVDDQWVRLKRREGKSGMEFRPMRKVLFGLQEDEETVA